MARLLCLDTEPETIEALRSIGHAVFTGEMGYRTGNRKVAVPPHEVDALIFDLKKPACFDRLKWGPYGGNDNFKCTIVPSPTPEQILISGKPTPRYVVIYDSQIENERRPRPAGTFGPYDVYRAVYVAGTPAIIFLNPEWVAHVDKQSPNILGVMWEFERTSACQVETAPAFREVVPEVEGPLAWVRPLRFAVVREPRVRGVLPFFSPKLSAFQDLPLVTNVIGQLFGVIVQFGKGRVFLLPPTPDNAALTHLVVSRLDALLAIPVGRAGEEPAVVRAIPVAEQAPPDNQRPYTRDAFISYASEDKESIARPLAERLRSLGLRVWFDEYELTMGDRLREKIDEGLRASRYGVVILSPSFFAKKWPQHELDGLVVLEEHGEKKILPVWHQVTAEDVKRYSPMLAGLVAADASRGLDHVIESILKVVKPRGGAGGSPTP